MASWKKLDVANDSVTKLRNWVSFLKKLENNVRLENKRSILRNICTNFWRVDQAEVSACDIDFDDKE